MAKKNTLAGLAVSGGIAVAGTLFNRKKKKDAQKAAEEAKNTSGSSDLSQGTDMGMQHPGQDAQPSKVQERTCPSCGNKDSSGSKNCPVCFGPMDPDAERGDFHDI